MLAAALTWIRVKLWFATVNRYRGWQASRKLKAYVKTLRPEQQAWANALSQRLNSAKSPGAKALVLRQTAADLNEQHARVIERIDQVHRS